MAQGMSEEEVKRRLYGELYKKSNNLPKKEAVPQPKSRIEKAPAAKISPFKPKVIIFSLIAIICSGLLLVIISRPRAKTEGTVISEVQKIKGYLAQGKKYYRDGLFDEAILTWRNILAVDPDNRAALRYIQRAEVKKKELKIREEDTAQKIKEMLAEREKRDREKISRGKEGASRQKIKIEVARLLKEGDTYYRQGDYERAIASYEKVLPLSPGYYQAVKSISRANEKIAEAKKAVAKVQKVSAAGREKGPIYTVQAATYADRAGAEALAKSLGQRGYSGTGVQELTGKSGRVWYCVYLGSFTGRDEAVKLMEKIKKDGFKDSFVKTR